MKPLAFLDFIPAWVPVAVGFMVGAVASYHVRTATASTDEPVRSWSLSGDLSVYRIVDGNVNCYVTEKAIACLKNP